MSSIYSLRSPSVEGEPWKDSSVPPRIKIFHWSIFRNQLRKPPKKTGLVFIRFAFVIPEPR